MAIRVYLDDVLRERGMTAKELCGKVGITEANLSILRSGKAKGVRFHTLNRIFWSAARGTSCGLTGSWSKRRRKKNETKSAGAALRPDAGSAAGVQPC